MRELEEIINAPGYAGLMDAQGFAHGLPPGAYRDPDFLKLEVERWFSKTWLLLGLAQEIPEAGDVMPVPFLPLILLRDQEGHIRCFHNVCRHRGHELFTKPAKGQKNLVCPYHGWCYGLDGSLRATPLFGGPARSRPENFNPDDHGLRPVRCEAWHDWIFVNLDGSAPPLSQHLAPLLARLGNRDFSALRPFHSLRQGEVKANWKLVLENSLEPYHTPFVHPQTGAGIPLKDHYMLAEGPLLGCGIDVSNEGVGRKGEENARNGSKKKSRQCLDDSSQFLVLPPLLVFMTFAERFVVVHRNIPHFEKPDRTWRSVHLYTMGGPSLSPADIKSWQELEYKIHVEEDGPVYESLQRNKASPVTNDGGVLSPYWETSVLAFYQQLLKQLRPT